MATDLSKVAAGNVENVEAHEQGKQGAGKKGRSDSMDRSMEKRFGDMEKAMTGLGLQVNDMLEQLDSLGNDFLELREDLKAAVQVLRSEVMVMVKEEITKLRRDMDDLSQDCHRSLIGMEAKVNDCGKALISVSGNTNPFAPKVKVPKPSPFEGKREARAVDDFLWEMERYFGGIGIVDDETKINTATMYLKDTAALWWRRRYGDVERGTCTIKTWAEFVRDLKRQFYPVNALHEAKSRLRKLKQDGSIQEYVKEFTTLTLAIPDLSDEDSLFYFLDGLEPWAKTELERRNVKDLASAIAAAESLVDLVEEHPHKLIIEVNKEHGGGVKRKQFRKKDARNTTNQDEGCFICGVQGHIARFCPKKASLHAMVAREDGRDDEQEARLGAVQLINTMGKSGLGVANGQATNPKATRKGRSRRHRRGAKTKAIGESLGLKCNESGPGVAKGEATNPRAKSTGLHFVCIEVNGVPTRALVDTGASHNFVSKEEATRLGLKATKELAWIKAAQGDAKLIDGMVQGVKAKIGDWKGTLDLSVAPMDDYKFVLGMDFFSQVQAFPMPFMDTLCIMDGERACMVKMERDTRRQGKTVSAMRLVFKSDKEEPRQVQNFEHVVTKEATKDTRRGRREIRWGRMSRPA